MHEWIHVSIEDTDQGMGFLKAIFFNRPTSKLHVVLQSLDNAVNCSG